MADTKVTIKNSDLFLVNRDDLSYKITGKLFKKEFGSFYVPDLEPPDVDKVIVEDSAGNSAVLRFEDQSFDVTTIMIDEGNPLADYSVKANVSGAIYDDSLISDRIIKIEGGGVETCETELIESVTGGTEPTTYDCKVFNGTFGDTPDGWDSLPATPKFDNVAIGTQPTATSTTYVGLVYKTDVPGFIRINPNAGGVDASTPVKLWSSDDGITWVGPTNVTQGNLDPSHASYDASIGFYAQYGCIQRQGGTNIAAWYPTGSKALTTLTFPSDKGFDCFEQGDVVQQDYPSFKEITGTINTGSWEGMFDGGSGFANFTADPVLIRFNADLPPANYAPRISLATEETSAKIRLYDSNKQNYVEWDKTADSITNNTPVTLTAKAVPFTVVYFEFTSTKDKTSYAIFKDGVEQVIPPGEIYKIISKTDKEPWQIVVDGGDWLGSNGSGTAGGDTELVKEIPYDTKLTVSSDKDLADMVADNDMVMSDGTPSGGPYTQTPYKLVTTDIESVKQNNYSGTTSNVHINSATDPAVLFDGYYAPGYHKGNIGSYYKGGSANYTTVINFTPEVTDATVIGHFRGGNGRYFDINYFDGSTQRVPASVDGPLIMEETPLTNNSGIVSIKFQLGDGQDSEWISGFKDANGDLIVNDIAKLTFPGDVSTNPDLQYFKVGDVVQSDEDGWNNDVVWSKLVNSPDGYYLDNDATKAFDGDKNTSCSAPSWNSAPITIDFSTVNLTANQSFKVSTDPNTTNDAEATLTTSGGDSAKVEYNGADGLVEILDNVRRGEKVVKLVISGSPTIGYLEVDGKELVDRGVSFTEVKVISNGYDLDPKQNTLTVDGGDWGGTVPGTNQTRNWNEGIDASAANAELVGKGPFARNDDNSQGLDYVYGFNNGHAVITFDPPLPFNKLQFRGLIGNNSPVCEFRVNGTHFSSITVSSVVTNTPITTYDGGETELRQILLYSTSNSAISALLQVIVDDEILLMPSTGDTHVEYQTNGGEGKLVATNTDDNTILLTDTGDRDNRWIAENKSATDFFVAGGVIKKDGATLNCFLVKSGNDLLVEDLVPETTNVPFVGVGQKDFKIKFKDEYLNLPTDILLPERSELCVTVKAENIAGSDEGTGCFIPELNTTGRSGPITDSDGYRNDTVEVLDIGGLVAPIASVGDPVIMTDLDGNPAEYTLTTTTIESVEDPKIAGVRFNPQVGLSTAGISNQTEETFEVWFNLDKDSNFSGSNIACFWSQKDSSTHPATNIVIQWEADEITAKDTDNGNAGNSVYHSIPFVRDGQWHHYALTKASDSTVKIYLDGKLQYTGSGWDHSATVNDHQIGVRQGSIKGYYEGFMSNCRMSDVVRYTDEFEPQLEDFVSDANTLYLLFQGENPDYKIDHSGNRTFTQIGTGSMEVGKDYGPAAGQITLTFPDSVITNPDLKYFQVGDVVQDNGASKSEAFPTDPTGSSSLVKFDVVSPIDAVTGETWNPIATAGAVPAPVTDPNAPAEWGLTKSVDLSLGGHYYSKGSSFDIGVGGALIIWAHFEYGTMSATVYEGTTTGGLQWGIEASSHGVLATASTIIPGADNESRGSFGNFPAGYHRVALIALAEGKIKLEIDGEPFGNVLNFNSNLIFDQIGGDHRVNYGDSGISIFAMQVIEDPNFGTEARVVSTDLVNNTMTVDGGDWLGSDGTGETDGDTQLSPLVLSQVQVNSVVLTELL